MRRAATRTADADGRYTAQAEAEGQASAKEARLVHLRSGEKAPIERCVWFETRNGERFAVMAEYYGHGWDFWERPPA